MDSNTSKGVMIGCLSSVGVLIVCLFLFFALFGLMMRGCVQATDEKTAVDRADGVLLNKPEGEGSFKKVWIEGKGGRDAPKVLKVKIHGVISSSVPQDLFSVEEETSSASALRKIRAAAKDRSIRGLYLDIDSPGGGVTAADEIHHAILKFKSSQTNRFVIVHMGDMCCSGGYYIAAPADWIMARPTTLTGSIGVIVNGVNASGLAGKIGLESVTIASAANKDLLNPLKPVNPEHVAIIRKPVEQLYERFVKLVADGRRLPVEQVKPLADGRIFSAEDALANKLIDGIGHADDVLAKIVKLAGGKPVRVVRYQESPTIMKFLSNSLLFESGSDIARDVKAALEREALPKAEYRYR